VPVERYWADFPYSWLIWQLRASDAWSASSE
jgi:hypothetical protein